MGFYSPAVVLNDAKRHGVAVLPVDVNHSAWTHDARPLPADTRPLPFAPDANNYEAGPHSHSSEPEVCTQRNGASPNGPSLVDVAAPRKREGKREGSSAGQGWALRLGLRQVKGIDEKARETLERERAIGPYAGVRDFVARTGLGEQVVERLIAIGAFDWTDAPRRELLWQLRTTMEDANPARPALGLTDDAQRALGASLPAMTFAEKVAADYRELGLSQTAHAVELFRERLTARGVITVAEAAKRRDRSSVRLAGLAVSVQHPMTAKNFVFIALEDETGMINVTLRPNVYQENRAMLHRHPLLVIDGTLQVESGVLNVVARRLHPVDAVIAENERETRLPLGKQQRMFR
jgi:error-prone DNA polymerase